MKNIRWALGVVLVIVGIGLLLINPIQQHLIMKMTVAQPISSLSVSAIEENRNVEANFDFDQTASVNWEGLLASYEIKNDLPVIGGVAIPSLDLRLPIMNGLADVNLYAGAGTMLPDQVMGMGNYPLVSHNMAKPGLLFSDIASMNKGDLIYVTDLVHVYIYQTLSVEMVAPTRVDVINEVPGKQLVTLVTCSDDIQNRWIVTGELVDKIAADEATTDILEILELTDQT